MNYNLNDLQAQAKKVSTWVSLKKLLDLISHERRNLILALIAILSNATLNLLGPFIIGRTIDRYIFVQHKNYDGVLMNCALLLGMFLVTLLTSYLQTMLMGGVGQR